MFGRNNKRDTFEITPVTTKPDNSGWTVILIAAAIIGYVAVISNQPPEECQIYLDFPKSIRPSGMPDYCAQWDK